MTTTRISELTIDFRGQPIRVYDIEYARGSLGEYLKAPEDCYEAEDLEIDYQVDSGNRLLNDIMEGELSEEVSKSILYTLIKEELN